MGKWIELKKDCIPSDILDGEWRVKGKSGERAWCVYTWDIMEVLGALWSWDRYRFRIRRLKGWEPKNCPRCGSDDKHRMGQHCGDVMIPDSWHSEKMVRCPVCLSDKRSTFMSGCSLMEHNIWHYGPKAPTHEEIMTKWWKNGWCWLKVIGVNQKQYYLWGASSDEKHNMPMMAEAKPADWFINRESADIPPEA